MSSPCGTLATGFRTLCTASTITEIERHARRPTLKTPVFPYCSLGNRGALCSGRPDTTRCSRTLQQSVRALGSVAGKLYASLGQGAASASAGAAFSRSDAELQAQGLELHWAVDDLDLDQLNTLFMKVGFPRRQKEKLAKALQHTLCLIWLRERETKQLVAFARATGDNVFNAVIWDVVVDPGFQGSGLGRVVMERLMFELVSRGISNIALYAEPNVVNFYKPMGFLLSPDGIRAMAYSRRRK